MLTDPGDLDGPEPSAGRPAHPDQAHPDQAHPDQAGLHHTELHHTELHHTEVVADRYELGPVIGRGGSATVHRAWDRRCERPVALKRYASGVSGPDRYRQDQELRTLSQLEHPGLVALFDAGTDDDRPYLVMQLVDGPSLTERLAGGPVPVAEAVDVGRHLASALRYVHAHGITHRDVKPANVLLDDGLRPLLADFGIALLVDTTRVTTTDAVVGTAAYMAPEQLRGEVVGPAADIYALGLVLLESITGRRAFPGTSAESIVARLHHGPAVPRDLVGGCTPLLERMTALVAAQRPDTRAVVGELAAVADRIVDSDGDHPAPMVAPADETTASTAAVRGGTAGTGRARRPHRARPSRRTVTVAGLGAAGVALAVAVGMIAALTLGRATEPVAGASAATASVPAAPPAPRLSVAVGVPVIPSSPAPAVPASPTDVLVRRADTSAAPDTAAPPADRPEPTRRNQDNGYDAQDEGAGRTGGSSANSDHSRDHSNGDRHGSSDSGSHGGSGKGDSNDGSRDSGGNGDG